MGPIRVEKSIETDTHCVCVYTSCGALCLRLVIKASSSHYCLLRHFCSDMQLQSATVELGRSAWASQ